MNSGLFLHNLHTYKSQTKINFRFLSLCAFYICKLIKLLRKQVRCLNFTGFFYLVFEKSVSKGKGHLRFFPRDRNKSNKSDKCLCNKRPGAFFSHNLHTNLRLKSVSVFPVFRIHAMYYVDN